MGYRGLKHIDKFNQNIPWIFHVGYYPRNGLFGDNFFNRYSKE